ncbi:cell wall-binding repeat-containing protein [Lagierella sp.]|uniref:cell wall-binding repeat-containing protein n=1 Tax=Lagierella sp. TaxID=2849657 RepID=UPI002639DA6E|nr:cell wall-binding repeat-containing protein [Lagierella sp.]
MNIKTKVASGLLAAAIAFSPMTTTLANSGLNVFSVNSKTLSETSAKIANSTEALENVYILSAEKIVDGISGGVLAGENKGAIVLTEDGKLSEESMNTIKKAKNVYAIGGDKAISDELLKGIANFKGRISGFSRFDTAVEIASKLDSKRNIIITDGEALADSLSATAYAVKNDMNILLTNGEEVPESTQKYLEENKDSEIYFVGGESSIPQVTKEKVYEIAGKDKSKISENTIKGHDRYETSLELLKRFGSFEDVVIANGRNYADAILATGLSSNLDSPMLLVNNISASEKVKGLNIKNIYSVSTGNISTSFIKNFVEKVLNTTGVEMPIKDLEGNVVDKIVKEVARTGWVKSNLNVRQQPGTNSKVLGVLNKGEKISGYVVGDWLRISYNNSTAYVANSFISDKEVEKDKPKEVESAGSQDNNTNSDQNFSYKKVMTVKATAYSMNEPGLSWRTASGIDLRQNSKVIAVDRRVIPLGTRVYVEGYGYAVAGDTGGAIKGNKIDVHMNSVSECYNWGVRTVKLYILD